MKHFLTIIRWRNLILVGIIQSLLYFRLLEWHQSVLKIGDVILLVIITILIAAGGYVINDYYDRNIDQHNKPQAWIAGNHWTLSQVLRIYWILTFMGLLLSLVLAIRLNLPEYLVLYPLAVTGLWLYSFMLKCKPIAGNLWVSIFCAGVIGIIALPDLIKGNERIINFNIWYYIVFAFLSTWYREIIKDIEDVEGDQKNNCQTAVVKFGSQAGKIMATILAVGLVIVMLEWEARNGSPTFKLILLILEGIIVASVAFMWWAKNKSYYHSASTMVKVVMLAGTLLLII
ncbi:MAG: UbiA family prenyltransferase [Bacteroidota bacterium]|nr:UbiA family prenyltransferase [Bacteroidota bacterium]